MSKYPEHEKLAEISERSQAIGEFLEWLDDIQIHLLSYQDVTVSSEVIHDRQWTEEERRQSRNDVLAGGEGRIFREYQEERLIPVEGGIEAMLARYFGIDQKKIEREKRAMLDEMRNCDE